MNGAGFVFDAINTQRSNRSLLKGKHTGHYKNFDTAYITDSIVSRKAPVYKKATQQYLVQLKLELAAANRNRSIKKLLLLAVTGAVSLLSIYLLMFN